MDMFLKCLCREFAEVMWSLQSVFCQVFRRPLAAGGKYGSNATLAGLMAAILLYFADQGLGAMQI